METIKGNPKTVGFFGYRFHSKVRLRQLTVLNLAGNKLSGQLGAAWPMGSVFQSLCCGLGFRV